MKKILLPVLLEAAVAFSGVWAQTNSPKLKAFEKSIQAEKDYNYSEALDALNDIYSEYASDYLVNLRLGWLYFKVNNFNESIRFYNQAVKISENSIEALLGLTYPLSSLNKWEDIENVYLKILDKDENNYTANLNLGLYYFNTKNFLNAKVRLEKVIDNYPSDYSANIYLGWALYYLGNEKDAAVHFERALIANPGDSSATEGLNLIK